MRRFYFFFKFGFRRGLTINSFSGSIQVIRSMVGLDIGTERLLTFNIFLKKHFQAEFLVCHKMQVFKSGLKNCATRY